MKFREGASPNLDKKIVPNKKKGKGSHGMWFGEKLVMRKLTPPTGEISLGEKLIK